MQQDLDIGKRIDLSGIVIPDLHEVLGCDIGERADNIRGGHDFLVSTFVSHMQYSI